MQIRLKIPTGTILQSDSENGRGYRPQNETGTSIVLHIVEPRVMANWKSEIIPNELRRCQMNLKEILVAFLWNIFLKYFWVTSVYHHSCVLTESELIYSICNISGLLGRCHKTR